MATRTRPTQIQQAGRASERGIPAQGTLGARVVLDLDNPVGTGIPEGGIINVQSASRISITAQAQDGATWATAVITLQKGVARDEFVNLEPESVTIGPGDENVWDLDVSEFAFLGFNVTTQEGSALSAKISWYVWGEEDLAPYSIPCAQSEGDQGSLIEVTGTTTGTSVTLATATSATDGGVWDEYDIEACNIDVNRVLLTIEVIDATKAPTYSLPAQSGFFTILQAHPLRSADTIKAFADTANKVLCRVKRRRVTDGLES